MASNVKKEYILEGLSCANCAAKIEKEIKNISKINNAYVNFALKKLNIEVNDKDELNNVIKEIKAIIKHIEPDIKVINLDDVSKDNYNKSIIRLIIGGILFILGLVLELPTLAEFTIFFISYIIVGGDIVLRALKNIVKGQIFDENFLMSIATIGAFVIGQFPEGVAVMLFYQVGELFQNVAVNHSRKSITALMDIRPDFANIKLDNQLKKVSPEDVKVGDIIVVKPGEKIPLDGKVIEGKSMVDTSSLTGESVPRTIDVGDNALSGCINVNGVLTIEVSKEFGQSTVSKILELVQNASSRKAATENFITKFARYYTPVVVIAALAIAIIPSLFIQGAIFSDWIYRALIFLVISCPCALVISIPLGFFGGIGGASKKGILVKGSNYLEALNNVEVVVFDKTGTLTKGVFNVTDINNEANVTKEELIEYAAYAESYSNHPIAISILKAYVKEVDKSKVEKYEEISGHGIKVKYQGKNILVGNDKLMLAENVKYNKTEST